MNAEKNGRACRKTEGGIGALGRWARVACAVIGALAPGVSSAQTPVKSVADIKALLSSVLPADALEIGEAFARAKAGETVVVHGYIARTKDAFSAEAAEFVLVEWPAAEGEKQATRQVRVRLVNAAGEVIREPVRDRHGLKSGAEVFATGRVVETAETAGALVLSATSLHVPRSPLAPGFFADKEPEGARDVSAARKSGELKKGDVVVLRGRIGGSKEPFVPGRAVFTIVGRGLGACCDTEGDSCSTPWDYCCETREDIVANSVTVQVVDEKGQVLRTDMKGRRGLKELTEVVVVGKVDGAGKAVVVNATAMWVPR